MQGRLAGRPPFSGIHVLRTGHVLGRSRADTAALSSGRMGDRLLASQRTRAPVVLANDSLLPPKKPGSLPPHLRDLHGTCMLVHIHTPSLCW